MPLSLTGLSKARLALHSQSHLFFCEAFLFLCRRIGSIYPYFYVVLQHCSIAITV